MEERSLVWNILRICHKHLKESAGKESNIDFREYLSLTMQHCILPDELAQKYILININ